MSGGYSPQTNRTRSATQRVAQTRPDHAEPLTPFVRPRARHELDRLLDAAQRVLEHQIPAQRPSNARPVPPLRLAQLRCLEPLVARGQVEPRARALVVL